MTQDFEINYSTYDSKDVTTTFRYTNSKLKDALEWFLKYHEEVNKELIRYIRII